MTKGQLLLLGGSALSGLLLFGALFVWFATGDGYGPDKQLDLAMELLDEGRWDLADRIARDIQDSEQLTESRQCVWNYVRGVAGALSTTDKLDSPAYRRVLWDAADFLEKARAADYPLGYRGRAAYYLGYCYFHTYAWDKALAELAQVPAGWPARRSDALDMMIEACLRSRPPKRQQAEEWIEQWSQIPGLAQSERNRITLNRAQLAMIDGDWDKCESILSSINPESAEYFPAKIGSGLWKLEAARHSPMDDPNRKARLEAALADFQVAILASATTADMRRRATYLSGETLRELGRTNEAISTLSGVRQRNPESAESIAAGVTEAEIQLSNSFLHDALETVRAVVSDMGDVRLYDERWVPLPELRRRLLQLGRDMRDQGRYEAANRLASYLPPVFPQSDSVRMEAETFETWDAKLEEELRMATARDRDVLRRQIDSKYLLAGDQYSKLARLELRSVEYPSILWKAIECYQKASQLDKANQLLKEYLQFEERPKRPRGLLALGQNHLNAGNWDEVLPPLERCLLEYPDHPTAYNVRLLMARTLTEKQNLEQATEMLMANLYDGNLRPDSQLWRDSLFELGNVIYRRGDQLFLESELTAADDWDKRLAKLESSHQDFLAATQRLSEAVTRFDRDKRSFEARYAIGRAYQSAAAFPKQMLDSGRISIESVRRRLLLERRQLLESALAGYRQLHDALGESQDLVNLPDSTQALLRNCYFGEADVLYELGQFEEAIAAYRSVGNRFMNEPEALEALMQISECFRELGQRDQARRTLVQAEQLLSRIPDESDNRFRIVTRTDRAGWQQLLAWLKK